MGKGSNVQKKQQAQLRNMKDKSKSEEERKAASQKALKDKAAFICELCKQTFMINARPPLLYQHVIAKHPAGTDPLICFPAELKDFDPNDPNGTKKPADPAPAQLVPKKTIKKKDADLDDLLNAGLTAGKKKK